MSKIFYAFLLIGFIHGQQHLSFLKSPAEPRGAYLSEEQKSAIDLLVSVPRNDVPRHGILGCEGAKKALNVMCYYIHYTPYLIKLEKFLENTPDIELIRDAVDNLYHYCSNNYTPIKYHMEGLLPLFNCPVVTRFYWYVTNNYNPLHSAVVRFKQSLNGYSKRNFNSDFPMLIAQQYVHLVEKRAEQLDSEADSEQKSLYPNFESYRDAIFSPFRKTILQYESFLNPGNKAALEKFNEIFKKHELDVAIHFTKHQYKNYLVRLLKTLPSIPHMARFKKRVKTADDSLVITIDNNYLLAPPVIRESIMKETQEYKQTILAKVEQYFQDKNIVEN